MLRSRFSLFTPERSSQTADFGRASQIPPPPVLGSVLRASLRLVLEKLGRVYKLADAGDASSVGIDFLIAHHRRRAKVHSMRPGEARDHTPLGLAAGALVGVIVRANLPRRQDAAELMIEVGERGLDVIAPIAPALDSGLIANDENQTITHRRELLFDARQQRDRDIACSINRELPRLVHRGKCADQIAKKPDVAGARSHY